MLSAAYQALRAQGYARNTSLSGFMHHAPKNYNNPNVGYAGSPFLPPDSYGRSKIQAMFASALANYAKRYGKAQNISGSTPKQLRTEIAKGHSVVAYVTVMNLGTGRYQSPNWHYYTNYGWHIANQHVMTVDGFRNFGGTGRNQYHVVDPAKGSYWVNASTFEKTYNIRKQAIVVR
jgi:uncharacterized protein YvpB